MSDYSAKDITVLEGLEAVRRRPGMYIGGTGPDGLHHLLWEVVDNSVDEAMNGHASKIRVILHDDGSTCTVKDNGRGIPVDVHPGKGVSALELILTTLHAGGKFENEAYKTSGGLHGVGASVVNALSTHLDARIKRSGRVWEQAYRHGRALSPVKDMGPARGSGTSITFHPDPEIFEDIQMDPARIREQLEIKTYLNPGLHIEFDDQVNDQKYELRHDGGVKDYLRDRIVRLGATQIVDPFTIALEGEGFSLQTALTWTSEPKERMLSYVNGIPTREGGTHEQGVRDSVVKALRSFMDTHSLAPKGLSITRDDLLEGTIAIISILVPDPQFQGQTKDKLNNPEIRGAVESAVRPMVEQWLHDNTSLGQSIIQRAVQAAKARVASRQAATAVRRKSATSGRLNLPGKLADCSSRDPASAELFLVEGDSAGGSAKQGRNRRTQAILPLRGKVLNAQQASAKKVMANQELSNIITALGCGVGADFRADRLRYERIILLMDADTDGHHISTLLLTFLYRFMRPLIEGGYVYLAQPPLYKIVAGKQTYWALDDRDKDQFLAGLPGRTKPEITRFKGLGEMPPKTLFETTLDPKNRRLLKVAVPDVELADQTFQALLGDDPSTRYEWIMDMSREVTAIDV